MKLPRSTAAKKQLSDQVMRDVDSEPSPSTRVVVTDHSFPDVEREAAVAARWGAEFAVFGCTSEDEVAAATSGAHVVLANLAPVTRRVLAGLAPGGTVIRYGVGYDNVDIAAATELGVVVANVPDYGVETVADHAATLLLTLARRIPRIDAATRTGWPTPSDLAPLPGFRSLTVGLIGTGRIGLALAERLRSFGMPLLAADPFVRAEDLAVRGIELVELPALLARSQVVSLHLPLTPDTRHLIDADALSLLPRGALLINTARGGLVDEAALADALTAGRVGGAALDVFEEEPLPADSPLRSAPNVLLTPHVAFYSDESMGRLQECVAEELERALSGAPLLGRI